MPRMLFLAVALIGICIVMVSPSAGEKKTDAQDKGAADMVLEGGSRGKVPFPHRSHQETLEDCDRCHSLFPREPDAIAAEIEKGALKERQVMNELCISCHREKRREGAATGPVTCSRCHQR